MANGIVVFSKLRIDKMKRVCWEEQCQKAKFGSHGCEVLCIDKRKCIDKMKCCAVVYRARGRAGRTGTEMLESKRPKGSERSG